jgi:hypothetical protein
MEQKRSPVQLYHLFKSFVMMFMIQAVVVLFTPLQLTAPIWYQIFAVNLIVAAVLGWYLYKQRYHIELSYDDVGFQLKKGKGPSINHKWNEFSQVSLARIEYGEFMVMVHKNGDRLEIPASKLKLDPFRFRLQVMEYVAKAASSPQ